MQAKVKWFDNRKGFGFIEQPSGDDIFAHYDSIEANGYRTLKQGQYVEFELIKTEKGLQAQHIKPVKDLQTIE